jgi:hypothetical protein
MVAVGCGAVLVVRDPADEKPAETLAPAVSACLEPVAPTHVELPWTIYLAADDKQAAHVRNSLSQTAYFPMAIALVAPAGTSPTLKDVFGCDGPRCAVRFANVIDLR